MTQRRSWIVCAIAMLVSSCRRPCGSESKGSNRERKLGLSDEDLSDVVSPSPGLPFHSKAGSLFTTLTQSAIEYETASVSNRIHVSPLSRL
jgi:hypothetical protein